MDLCNDFSANMQHVMTPPGTNLEHADRPRKKRASKACTACRERKVRCDVSRTGLPCSNCDISHRQCMTKQRVRRRLADRPLSPVAPLGRPEPCPVQLPIEQLSAHPTQLLTTEESFASIDTSRTHLSTTRLHDDQLLANTRSAPGAAVQLPELTISDHVQGLGAHAANTSLRPAGEANRGLSGRLDGAIPSCSASLYDVSNICSPSLESYDEAEITASYYSFLVPHAVSQLPIEDVQFLERLKCFHVPVWPILNEIVRSYFLHVQPHFPIFDEAKFGALFNAIAGAAPVEDRISLFTFQAFLCVACSFADLSTLRKLGFNGARQARYSYYRRAKAIFDLGAESDNLSIAQGALLLTYFTPKTDSTANSYWLGVGIEHARRIHAHEYQLRTDLSDSRRAQLKRLWWCCILRDTTLSLGLRRPLHIPSSAARLPPSLLNEQDFKDEIIHSKVYDAATKRALVKLLSLFCELALCLLEVLEILYPRWGISATTRVSEGAHGERRRRLWDRESKMEAWYHKASGSEMMAMSQRSSEKSLIVLRNLIYMAYHSAKAAIYNDAILITVGEPVHSGSEPSFRSCQEVKLEDAVTGITQCLMEVLRANLISNLPVSSVAFATLPLVWYIVGSRLAATTQETSTLQDCVHIFTKAMKVWQSLYEGADAIIENVARLMKRIKLQSAHSTPGPSRADSDLALQRRPSRSSQLKATHRVGVSGWMNALFSQPSMYASIITAIDMSLASGHYPKFSDLPLALQMHQNDGMFPLFISPSLEPGLLKTYPPCGVVEETDIADEESFGIGTVHLDGISQSPDLAGSELMLASTSGPTQTLLAMDDSHSMQRGSWVEQQILQQLLQGYGEVGIAG